MAEFQNTIDLIGDGVVVVAIVGKNITEFNDDILNKVGSKALYQCASLTTVNLPNATEVGSSAFNGCNKLVSAYIPKAITIGNNAFQNCSKLQIADISNATRINFQAFAACKALTTIILRSPTVCTLTDTYTFNSTPFTGVGGTAYVPQSLISQYQQATNWSTLYAAGTCNFVAIEGSEYE